MDIRRTRFPCAATVAGLALLLSACEPSAAERERMARLAEIERIAVVTMAGKASVAPESRLYRGFMDDLLAAFEEAARETPPLVEFLPIGSAVNDPALPSRIGSSIVRGIAHEIERARDLVDARTPR